MLSKRIIIGNNPIESIHMDSKVKYSPKLTVEQIAKKSGVSVSTVREYNNTIYRITNKEDLEALLAKIK